MVIEGLEFDFGVGRLHNLVDFAIFLAADEFTMFVGQLNLETDFVMERLGDDQHCKICAHKVKVEITLISSSSITMDTAARTSCSRPCISKHMLLKTTSAPVEMEICLRRFVTWGGLRVAGGSRALNWTGKSQKEPT